MITQTMREAAYRLFALLALALTIMPGMVSCSDNDANKTDIKMANLDTGYFTRK